MTSTHVRKISSDLQQVAINELNEDPKRINEDIEHVRDWLSKQPHLKARTDSQWLIAYIRGCKHNMQITKRKLEMYYTNKTLHPKLFSQRNPFDEGIQRTLKLGVMLPLPLAYKGTPIVFFRPGVYDVIDTVALIKSIFMQIEMILLENDNYVINGTIFIIDMKLAKGAHLYNYINEWNQFIKCTFNVYPVRVKESNLINTNAFTEALINVIRTFLSQKQKDRMSVYGVGKEAQLYERIPQKYLPIEYGGENGSLAELTEHWKKKMESYHDYFVEDEMYCSDESKRQEMSNCKEDYFGAEGTFKNINID